jgi:hypothetical protein
VGIKLGEQEGKSVYILKVECHNSSYRCIVEKKSKIDLEIECNKLIKSRKLKDVMFDTRKMYGNLRDRSGIAALSFASGNGKKKKCVRAC